jgi:hypothetical protein
MSIYNDLLSVLISSSLSNFTLVTVEEFPSYIILHLEENPSNLPQTLQNTANVVLDGFLNPVDIQTYPLKDKPVFFRIFRRRWKVSCSPEYQYNQHSLHPVGVKATFDLLIF